MNATARRRYFLRCCEEHVIEQTVYHGSPVEGLADIKRQGRLKPQDHGELPTPFLSVSVNDNMLSLFSDGQNLTGFSASGVKLRCLKLDWFHHGLATTRYGPDDLGRDDDKAWRLGYSGRFEPEMSEVEFPSMLPDWVDGLLFPWSCVDRHAGFSFGAWNEEAEIALTQRGCDKVWAGIDLLWVNGEEHDDLRAGWRAVRKAVRMRHRCLA